MASSVPIAAWATLCGAFRVTNKVGAMYFTVTVFSTVGFGDITANNRPRPQPGDRPHAPQHRCPRSGRQTVLSADTVGLNDNPPNTQTPGQTPPTTTQHSEELSNDQFNGPDRR
ncbi:MAG: potassium channel family protein, partial [Mycobacterium sp.]